MVWIVLNTAYPGPPPKMVCRGGTEKNCRDWIAKRRNRERDKVDRGAYVIEGHPERDDGLQRGNRIWWRVSADEG